VTEKGQAIRFTRQQW